ncbi:hypothetical protein SFR_3078 [Streptomyces sp. FR-008]|nr:hypothetical protein SFR_3078 [Streptomyces sp. FR-008]
MPVQNGLKRRPGSVASSAGPAQWPQSPAGLSLAGLRIDRGGH